MVAAATAMFIMATLLCVQCTSSAALEVQACQLIKYASRPQRGCVQPHFTQRKQRSSITCLKSHKEEEWEGQNSCSYTLALGPAHQAQHEAAAANFPNMVGCCEPLCLPYAFWEKCLFLEWKPPSRHGSSPSSGKSSLPPLPSRVTHCSLCFAITGHIVPR